MNKKWTVLVSLAAAVSLMATSAWAEPNNGKGHKDEVKVEQKSSDKDSDKGSDKDIKVELEDHEDGTVTGDVYGSGGKGHNGAHGLQNAYEHVKDKPAGKVIERLLQEKYGIDAAASAEALNEEADKLAGQGDVETAVDVQKEAVKLDTRNLKLYKSLGKLYEKMGKKGVKAYVNGEEPKFEVPPFIKDGSTLVPFRAIAEALKAEVSWNQEERSVTVTKDGIEVKLFIGKTTAYVNGKEVQLEVPGEIDEGNTMVPARFISESLKAVVDWDQETQSVVITDGQA